MLAKIMTFNLRVDTEEDGDNAWPYRIKAVADVFKRHDADFVSVQECLHPMLADLEPLVPEYAWIGKGREGGTKGEYTAIFYKKDKWTVLEEGHFSLSETPEILGAMSWNTSHPRMCTWITAKSQAGDELAIFNTHLDHISEEAQLKGMELIRSRMKQLRERTGLPVILTGDFNVYPEHAVVAGLEQDDYQSVYAWLSENHREIGTTVHHFKGDDSGKPIDYIYLTPDWKVHSVLIDRGFYEGRYPSDHYPVIAEVSLDNIAGPAARS